MGMEEFREALIKMHEEDDNTHALQWFLNDIFELAEENFVDKIKKKKRTKKMDEKEYQDLMRELKEQEEDEYGLS